MAAGLTNVDVIDLPERRRGIPGLLSPGDAILPDLVDAIGVAARAGNIRSISVHRGLLPAGFSADRAGS